MILVLTYPFRLAQKALGLVFPNSVYVLWIPELTYAQRFKFGLSGEVRGRLASIRQETGEDVRVFLSLPMPWAKPFEQGLLHATRRFAATMPYHSGHREWRRLPNCITALLLWSMLWAYDVNGAGCAALAILFAPLPLDAALCLVLIASVCYALLMALLWGALVIFPALFNFVA